MEKEVIIGLAVAGGVVAYKAAVYASCYNKIKKAKKEKTVKFIDYKVHKNYLNKK